MGCRVGIVVPCLARLKLSFVHAFPPYHPLTFLNFARFPADAKWKKKNDSDEYFAIMAADINGDDEITRSMIEEVVQYCGDKKVYTSSITKKVCGSARPYFAFTARVLSFSRNTISDPRLL